VKIDKKTRLIFAMFHSGY